MDRNRDTGAKSLASSPREYGAVRLIERKAIDNPDFSLRQVEPRPAGAAIGFVDRLPPTTVAEGLVSRSLAGGIFGDVAVEDDESASCPGDFSLFFFGNVRVGGAMRIGAMASVHLRMRGAGVFFFFRLRCGGWWRVEPRRVVEFDGEVCSKAR